MTVTVEVLTERLVGFREDIVRLDNDVRRMGAQWDESAQRHGERVGLLEKELVTLRRDFRWSAILAGIIWTFIQALAIAAGSAWLNRGENARTITVAAARADAGYAVERVEKFERAMKEMGVDLDSSTLTPKPPTLGMRR